MVIIEHLFLDHRNPVAKWRLSDIPLTILQNCTHQRSLERKASWYVVASSMRMISGHMFSVFCLKLGKEEFCAGLNQRIYCGCLQLQPWPKNLSHGMTTLLCLDQSVLHACMNWAIISFWVRSPAAYDFPQKGPHCWRAQAPHLSWPISLPVMAVQLSHSTYLEGDTSVSLDTHRRLWNVGCCLFIANSLLRLLWTYHAICAWLYWVYLHALLSQICMSYAHP